jgi:hypothetical protein
VKWLHGDAFLLHRTSDVRAFTVEGMGQRNVLRATRDERITSYFSYLLTDMALAHPVSTPSKFLGTNRGWSRRGRPSTGRADRGQYRQAAGAIEALKGSPFLLP